MPDLGDRVALVTGAGRGIGRGCARELARGGATVLINDRPGSPDLEGAAEEMRSYGVRCEAIEADVFCRDGCEQLVSTAMRAAGQIDVLVSNPAWSRRCSFLELDPEVFERTIQATLTAGFHISQLVSRQMVERSRGGKIVFVSSVQAEMPMAGSVAYGAAKAALNHMTQSMAVELAPHRIHVNAIEPGWIDTPGEHETFGDATIRHEGAKLPLGRLGTPDDIGKAAAFLCSSDANYITGTILVVDGGFRAKHCAAEAVISPSTS